MKATGVIYQNLYDQMMSIAWPSPITRDKAMAFIQSFLRKRQIENTDPVEYTDMAYVYLLQKLGSKYREIVKPLLAKGILQSTCSYKVGYYNDEGSYIKGQCLSYRLNPKLMDDEIIKVVYDVDSKKQRCRDEVTMRSKQLMRQLRIPDMNSREIINFVKLSLTDDRIRKMLKVNNPNDPDSDNNNNNAEIKDDVIMLKTLVCRKKPQENGGKKKSEHRENRVGEKKKPLKEYQIKHVKLESIKLKTKSLIKDGKFCYVDHLDEYIKRKRRHLVRAYCDQLLRIKHRNVYADRNDTNLRLDSNLTNLKSQFISLLQMDGQRLGQIDLKNSQFRFFVMLLEQTESALFSSLEQPGPMGQDSGFPASEFSSKITAKQNIILKLGEGDKVEGKQVTLLSILFSRHCAANDGVSRSLSSDYRLFRKLVKTGQLYEHIQQIHWAETGETISRDEAKKMMFGISFSSYRYWPEAKRTLAKAFPSIVALIDDFKKEMIKVYSSMGLGEAEARDKGNASFAVMLQQVESLVFIDKILAKCHKAGIKALSKHDSIVFRESDRSHVAATVIKVLNKVFGKFSYSLDIDGELFILKPKKESRFKRKAFAMLHNLFTSGNRANAPPAIAAKQMETAAAVHKDYKYKAVSMQAYNARAPRPLAPGVKPLKNARLERLRKKWYFGSA